MTDKVVSTPEVEFLKFPKIPRLEKLNLLITEKIDGTNAQIVVSPEGQVVRVGSRNRWITPGKQTDNFGFASWVEEHKESLALLGTGTHYGEWYGLGIGRGYGLTTRHFALFNTHRPIPEGCPVSQVPVLWCRQLDLFNEDEMGDMARTVARLARDGSVAVPGFMFPEGVVITLDGHNYKHIFDKRGPSPEELN